MSAGAGGSGSKLPQLPASPWPHTAAMEAGSVSWLFRSVIFWTAVFPMASLATTEIGARSRAQQLELRALWARLRPAGAACAGLLESLGLSPAATQTGPTPNTVQGKATFV
jgi:hypothetical protein